MTNPLLKETSCQMETAEVKSLIEKSFSPDDSCTVEESRLKSAGGCVGAVSNANDQQNLVMLDLVCNCAADGGVGSCVCCCGGIGGIGGIGGGGGGESGGRGGIGDVGVGGGGGGGGSEDGMGSGGGRSAGGVGKGGHGSGGGVGGGTGIVGDSGVADENGGEGVGGGGSGGHGRGSGGGRSGGGVGNGGSVPGGGDGSGIAGDGKRGYGGDSGVAGENENVNEEEEDDDVEGDEDEDDKNGDEDDCKVKIKDEDKDDLDESHYILLCETSSLEEESSGSADSLNSEQCDTGVSSVDCNFPVACSSAQLKATAAVWNGPPLDTEKFSDDDCRRWKSCKMCQSHPWKFLLNPCADLCCDPCREQLTNMICTLCGKQVEEIVTVKLAHEM